MAPDQAGQPATESSERLGSSQAPRPGRRAGRGRRGGRRRQPRRLEPARQAPPDASATSPQPIHGTQATSDLAPVETEFSAPPAREKQPASPATIQQAIAEVTQIIATLRDTLEEMDEVLETLELAERQKTADEQDIESMRRALRQLQRPRESGPPPQRTQSSEPR